MNPPPTNYHSEFPPTVLQFSEPEEPDSDNDSFLDGYRHECMFACDSPLNKVERKLINEDFKFLMIEDLTNKTLVTLEQRHAFACPILPHKHYALAKDDPNNIIYTFHQVFSHYHGSNNHSLHVPSGNRIGNIPLITMRCVSFHGPIMLPVSKVTMDQVSVMITCQDEEMFDYICSFIRKDAVIDRSKLQFQVILAVPDAIKFKMFMNFKYMETKELWNILDHTKFPNVKYMLELARLRTQQKQREFADQYRTPKGYVFDADSDEDDD
jgi:hypothetical protein